MENDKGDDLGLPQENLAGDEPIANGPAPEGPVPEGPDMPAADAPLDDLDFEPLDMPLDDPLDDGLLEGVEPGDIDPDMLSPDPLAETAEFSEPDADGLLSPDFGDGEAAPLGIEPDGLGFPMGDESISDAEPKMDAESKMDDEAEPKEEEEKEEKESFLQKLANASPYTVMLGIALLAIVMGILYLFMELKSYDFKWKRDDARVAAPYSAPANPQSDYA